jgi:8-oxo-dGTP diphosphatase
MHRAADTGPAGPWTLEDVKSPAWAPQQRATLLFVVHDGQILLIHKKRGLGRGKINGPGGRLEPGETAREAAIREVREEVGVDVRTAHGAGRLKFQFTDGLSLDVIVFTAEGCEGTPVETDEAVPLWAPTAAIPYGRMWPDDVHWVPMMLAGQPFLGHFLFDGETLMAHDVAVVDRGAIELACGERHGQAAG